MEPARMSITLVLLLGLGGIGGAVRACASASRAGSKAAQVSSRAFRVTPKAAARLAKPTRVVPAGIGRRHAGAAVVGGSLSDDVARGAAARGVGVAGDEAAVGGVRSARSGATKTGVSKTGARVSGTSKRSRSKVGDRAGDGLDLAGGDDD